MSLTVSAERINAVRSPSRAEGRVCLVLFIFVAPKQTATV